MLCVHLQVSLITMSLPQSVHRHVKNHHSPLHAWLYHVWIMPAVGSVVKNQTLGDFSVNKIRKSLLWYACAVSEEDKNLSSPFTTAPTASLIIEKEKQSQQKAHPPGPSKILSKAREKAAQQDHKQVQIQDIISFHTHFSYAEFYPMELSRNSLLGCVFEQWVFYYGASCYKSFSCRSGVLETKKAVHLKHDHILASFKLQAEKT